MLHCQDGFTVAFGRALIAHLGGDASAVQDDWCWAKFGRAFPELREGAERYFERAETGDPAWAACCMVRECGSVRAWAEGVIERAQTGNPAWAACYMVRKCGSGRAWAEGVRKRAIIGRARAEYYNITAARKGGGA